MTYKINSEELANLKHQKSARKINTNIFAVVPGKSPSLGKLEMQHGEPTVSVTFNLSN